MKFWRIDEPDYKSGYQSSYINGHLEHPYGLPGVKCSYCTNVHGGSRILPFTIPEKFKELKEINDRWLIPLVEHKKLQENILKELGPLGHGITSLEPGDDFQPSFLDVPSFPRADFLGATIGSLVVSERIMGFISQKNISGISIHPVNMRKIGKRWAKLRPPMPSTGEPEDIIDEVPILKNTDSANPYYEIVILKESGYPPGGEPVSVCHHCGYEEIDNEKRTIAMDDNMWNGDDIFYLKTTLIIVITDKLMKELKKLRPTNVCFKRI